MIGKIAAIPAFQGTIEITPKTWLDPAMRIKNEEIKRIDGQPNGDTKITMNNGYKVNVLKECASLPEILDAYNATKDNNLTVGLRKEDSSEGC